MINSSTSINQAEMGVDMKAMLVTVIMMFSTTIASAQTDIQLRFGVYTSDKPSSMVKMFRPLLNEIEIQLSKRTGKDIKIRLSVAKSYEQGIEDLVTGKVDFARMGPASYVISKRANPNLRLLAMESKGGKKVFYGIICVKEESTITEISQLRGESFAFGSKRSSIGRYLAQQTLVDYQVRAKDLSSFEYLGRHDRVGSAVGSGSFAGGALKESTFKKLKEKGIPIREIARFPNVTKPWIASESMSEELATSLIQLLLSLDNAKVLKGINKNGFLPASGEDYSIIRQSIESNDEFFL